MKVLVLANCSGGLYRFRLDLIKSLMQDHSVVILTPISEHYNDLCNLECEIIETPMERRGINPFSDLKLLFQYYSLLRQMNGDMVITYTIKPNIYGGIVCRLLRIPYAANITGIGSTFQKKGILRSLIKLLYRVALAKAKVVFFENAGNRSVFLKNRLVKDSQCCLLNGAGVNLDYYFPAPYPQDENVTRFLFVGRVMQEKGVGELLEATERLINEGYACTLDILGYFEEDYEKVIDDKTTAGWLHYHGNQADVRPYIAQSHCFVLPSWHEGMANTNLECAAMARPLITSNIHGCKEAVIDGESGFLCEPKNADSLYEAMKRFCSLPVDRREQMGIRGRQHMEDVFDKKKVVEKTIKELGV